MSAANVPVRFLQAHRLWNSGEIAGFPKEEGQRLVDAGVASWDLDPAEPEVVQLSDPDPDPDGGDGGGDDDDDGQGEA